MPLMWSHEFDTAMLVVEIVPVAKFQHLFARVFYARQSFVGIVRSVFTRFKNRLRIRVIVAHSWSAKRRGDA